MNISDARSMMSNVSGFKDALKDIETSRAKEIQVIDTKYKSKISSLNRSLDSTRDKLAKFASKSFLNKYKDGFMTGSSDIEGGGYLLTDLKVKKYDIARGICITPSWSILDMNGGSNFKIEEPRTYLIDCIYVQLTASYIGPTSNKCIINALIDVDGRIILAAKGESEFKDGILCVKYSEISVYGMNSRYVGDDIRDLEGNSLTFYTMYLLLYKKDIEKKPPLKILDIIYKHQDHSAKQNR